MASPQEQGGNALESASKAAEVPFGARAGVESHAAAPLEVTETEKMELTSANKICIPKAPEMRQAGKLGSQPPTNSLKWLKALPPQNPPPPTPPAAEPNKRPFNDRTDESFEGFVSGTPGAITASFPSPYALLQLYYPVTLNAWTNLAGRGADRVTLLDPLHKSFNQLKSEWHAYSAPAPNGPQARNRGIARWKAEKATGKVVKRHSLKIKGNKAKQHQNKVDEVAKKLEALEQRIKKGNREIENIRAEKKAASNPASATEDL